MARFFFCLCLVLSLCMDGSRWSAALASGSFGNGSWWGAREFRQLDSEAARLRRGGGFAGAEALYERQLALAHRNQDEAAAIRSLINVGGVRVLEHHYRSALQPMLEARRRGGMTTREAIGSDHLGEEWFRRRQPTDAERALGEASRIRIFRDRVDLPFSYARLGGEASGIRDRLNLKLTEMELDARLRAVTNQDENFRTGASLTHLRRVLSNRDLFLSYSLGDKRSYLRALTRESLHLYALAPSAQISSRIREFREQIRDGRATAAGSGLYDELFRAAYGGRAEPRYWAAYQVTGGQLTR